MMGSNAISTAFATPRAALQKGRERSLLRGHPWVFSRAISQIQGNPQAGDTIEILDHNGHWLGRGAYSPASQIRMRIWTFDKAERVDEAFFGRRIQDALALRQSMQLATKTNAYRMICAESDGLPGLIVDRYDRFLVCQFLSAGAERWKLVLVQLLQRLDGVQGIYERSEADVRKKEGLPPYRGVLWGLEPPDLVEIYEQGLKFLVDVKTGHKTGFYLDQRDNRDLVRSMAAGAEVLNCFAYTGGFGLAALKGGARFVTNVEDVAGLITLTDKNIHLNQFDSRQCNNVKADVFQLLRRYQAEGRSFDMIILDPPRFAESQGQLPRASRGYKDINRLAFTLLRAGGFLATFSCSGLMKMELFQKIVADAAIDAHCDARILQWLSQSTDHPVRLRIPESRYLKGLMLQRR
jgi:23S rRNA (cytosine1962-C5)-methyltransferase